MGDLEPYGTPPAPQALEAGAQAAPGAAATHSVRKRYLWYRVVAKSGHLEVTVRLLRPPPVVSFFLPGAWAGRDDWAGRLRLRRAHAPGGEVTLTPRQEGRLEVQMFGAKPWVELHYDVLLGPRDTREARFMPQWLAGNEGFLLYAPTFLILPSEQIAEAMRDIVVEVQLPHGHRPLTTWRQIGPGVLSPERDTYGYLVPDVRALRDAYLASHPAFVWAHTPAISLAAEPSYKGDLQALAACISELVGHYQAQFGAVDPLHVLVRIPHDAAKVQWGTGRENGFVLELDPTTGLDTSTKLLLAHEAFHLWNGHKLVPHPKDEARTRWFKEGITQYVALRALLRMGQLTPAQFLGELTLAARRYQHDIAAPYAWTRAAPTAHFPYDFGLLLALELDLTLRAHHKTLAQWLAPLIERAERLRHWRYDLDALWLAYAAQLPQDQRPTRFWQAHIEGDLPLDLPALFSHVGLHWLPGRPGQPARLIPLASGKDRWASFLTP